MHIFKPRPGNGECGRPRMIAAHVFCGLLLAATLALVIGYVVMFLWNSLIPDIFNSPRITYWQGVGLLLLARILTGRIGHGHRWCGPFRSRRDRLGWKEYEAWWNEVGEKSFCRSGSEPQKDPNPGE